MEIFQMDGFDTQHILDVILAYNGTIKRINQFNKNDSSCLQFSNSI